MSTQIFLIRHGSHDRLDRVLCGRMSGVGLAEAGRREAIRLARHLSGERITALYISPLQRAEETAGPLARSLGLSAQTSEDLNEIDMGDWTGASFDDLEGHPEWARRVGDRLEAAPGGETMQAVQTRTVHRLKDVRDRHPDTGVAAVSHADVIKAAVCYALDLPLDHYRRLDVGPSSVSVLIGDASGFRLHSLNEIPH